MKNKVATITEFALPKQSHARTIVLAGLAVLALFVAAYVYFVGKIVFDVVGRRTADASMQKNTSAISSLQVAYFTALKDLDMSAIADVGLSESRDTLYAVRPGKTPTTVGLVTR